MTTGVGGRGRQPFYNSTFRFKSSKSSIPCKMARRCGVPSGVPSGVPGFRAARGGPLVKVEVTAGPARHDALHVCPFEADLMHRKRSKRLKRLDLTLTWCKTRCKDVQTMTKIRQTYVNHWQTTTISIQCNWGNY